MQNALGSPRLMMALLAAGLLLGTAACKPEPSTAFNPQIDGLVYQPPAQPDLSLLGDQKTLHPAPIRTTSTPTSAAPAASPATAPVAETTSAPAATSSQAAPAAPALETAPATTAPAATSTDAPTPAPG
jgi:hypothetical protein